uniref:Uncharacterized protein n=1 Tax=uncultured bacterium fosmid pJB42G5 TaxID=1478064 RepID=A0A0H3U7S3_9BACT|nr:hypothetical protein [uncultured bacterium fosmid pJB42G5]
MKRIIALFAVLLPLSIYAQDIKVSAPNLVAADEQFKVTFSVEGDKPSDFNWSPTNDFQLVWGPQKGFSSSTSIVNGKVTSSSTSTYTYILLPKATGSFTLPGATAKIKSNSISSKSFTIEVVSGGSSTSGNSGQSGSTGSSQQGQSQVQAGTVSGDDLYMRLHLSSTSAVVGQPITATIKLYQRVDISGFDDATFPSFNGFWSQDITPQGDIHFVREKVGDQIYNTAVIRKYVIIPQMSGDLTIDGSELICRVYQKVQSRGNSIFDGFFDDYTTVRKRVTTPATKVHVSPLPGGAPASFGGGVGDFKISAKISRDTLATHEAASLVVTISGRGNVSLLEAPKVNFPPDVEVYDTKATENIDKASGSISGSKTYEYPFIPRSHGDFEIEPISYSYYDIAKGRYVTVETEAIPFHVVRGNESDAPATTSGTVISGVSKKGVKNLGEDIRFIFTKNPSFSDKGDFFAGSGLFWALAGILAAIAAAIWASLRKVAALKADVAGTKTRKATKMALKRLKLSETFLKQNLYTAFYEELHKALLGFISDKLSMPATDLSKENISEALAAGGVNNEVVESFINVLDACEYARYAPDAGHDAMEAHYKQALGAISSIDAGMKKKSSAKGVGAAVAILLMMLPLSAKAQQVDYVDSLWAKANKAYTEGQWFEALESWHAIDEAGLQSPELYYNIGNAWYKSESYAKAILYYERALKLDPSYSDARYNLEIAKAFVQDDIDPVPEFVLKTWWRKLCYVADSTTWAVICLILFAITLAMVLLFLLAPGSTGKKVGFFAAIVALILTVIALDFSIAQKRDYFKTDKAIVMRPVAPVKSSPSAESSSDLFVLHEGTKVQILDNVAEWTNIELADGRQGWIRSESLEII